MKLQHHIGWRYFLLESTLLWKNLFSDGPIRKPCTYRGKLIFLLKNLRKRRLLNRRPLSGTTCSLEPDRRPSANINGSKNATSVFLYFFDHVFLFLHFVLHNLHFGSQTTSSQEISTDQKFIPLGKVWQRTRAKAKHCDGRNPTISRRHNLNFQTSNGNNIMGRYYIFKLSTTTLFDLWDL